MKTVVAVACMVFLAAFCLIYAGRTVQAQGSAALTHPPVDAAACGRLASLALPNSSVTMAQMVGAGAFKLPSGVTAGTGEMFSDLPAFCRVALTIAPSSDSNIKSEVWLPMSGWNGKFQEVGNGGWGGSIQYGELADAVRRGYVAASTDTGHLGGSAGFALGHPEKLIDFGYRAIHETALQGKATLAALYGTAQQLSYFVGCSGGGRQAFMEAQRFPEDFEGIIAGAPGYNRTDQSFQLVAVAQATMKDEASHIPAEKLPVLHQAALDACDARDGLKDGLISDPTHCKFDPAVTLCKGADAPTCLTAAQVEAARHVYAPLKDPKTGQQIFPGFQPGSELRWTGTAGGPRPLGVADDLFKYVIFKDPNWDFHTLNFDQDLALARKVDGGDLSPTSANLRPFVSRGGKLIMYHGWGDQNVAPESSTTYYNRLIAEMGKRQVENSVRLYMVPGMGHCGGGEGPNVFDALTALEQWREHSTAPKEIIASQLTGGKVTRTRPLCPYPQVGRYKGAGDVNDAASFVCKVPESTTLSSAK